MSKLKLLFLCTGNSCRSQMAEGWIRHLMGDEIKAMWKLSPEHRDCRVQGEFHSRLHSQEG